MKLRLPLIVSLMLIALMSALSAWAWSKLPPGAQIAIHWNAEGLANGFAPRDLGLAMAPLISLALALVLWAIPQIEPRRFNLKASAKFYVAVWIGTIAFLAVAHGVAVLSALHMPVDTRRIMLWGLALLFAVIGNFIGKSRSNFFAGVRTPWTLTSDYSWEKTNRLTGRLFVLAAVAGVVASFAVSGALAFRILIGGVLGTALIGVAASYVYWRRDPARRASDGVPE